MFIFMSAHKMLSDISGLFCILILVHNGQQKPLISGLVGICASTCDEFLLETGARLEDSLRRRRTDLVLCTCVVVGFDRLESFLFGGFRIF